MSALTFAVIAFAVWRCAALLAYERGPLDVFVRLRTLVGITAGDDGTPLAWDDKNLLQGLLVCVWCNSIWLGALWAALWALWPVGAWLLALPLALSAGAILVEKVNHG